MAKTLDPKVKAENARLRAEAKAKAKAEKEAAKKIKLEAEKNATQEKADKERLEAEAKIKEGEYSSPEPFVPDPKEFGKTHTIRNPSPEHRKLLSSGEQEILSDVDLLIKKLKILENVAIKSRRPHKHYFAFQQRLNSLSASFKKMMR
jgi:hypothetical protein